ncbi:hypothetical protein LTR94_034430 [Friedmanniomyces endolithicus]|nr:hypothetical protein LTR94_034430 [Friedmanniomyces endolithicus]
MMLSDGAALFTHCSTKLCYVVTTPDDRVAIIVTEPLTTNEEWTHFAPGELKVFVDGLPQ